MAKVDITNENETKQEPSTYKGFNNKYINLSIKNFASLAKLKEMKNFIIKIIK